MARQQNKFFPFGQMGVVHLSKDTGNHMAALGCRPAIKDVESCPLLILSLDNSALVLSRPHSSVINYTFCLITVVLAIFLTVRSSSFPTRHPAAPRAEEDGRQSSAGGGPVAGEQDLPRSQQPAQGPRGPHLSQDHRQRHLLPPQAPGSSGHAVR